MNLAIKGHATRGKEVIELLEMLGGKNTYRINNTETNLLYCLREGDNVIIATYPNSSITRVFTLERFLEKFPYKVGDKVSSKYLKNYKIAKMEWEDTNNRVIYKLQEMGWYAVNELQPYKEDTVEEQKAIPPYMDYDVRTEEPKELLIGFTKDNNGDWILNTHKDYEIKEENGTFKLIKKQPQYPKTYEECCKVLDYEPDRQTVTGYDAELIENFQTLKLCRDAYRKIAGDWKPDFMYCDLYCIGYDGNVITWKMQGGCRLLVFPTKEMREAFYENFKELIENCKELL